MIIKKAKLTIPMVGDDGEEVDTSVEVLNDHVSFWAPWLKASVKGVILSDGGRPYVKWASGNPEDVAGPGFDLSAADMIESYLFDRKGNPRV